MKDTIDDCYLRKMVVPRYKKLTSVLKEGFIWNFAHESGILK
jgi:hypothetical protein